MYYHLRTCKWIVWLTMLLGNLLGSYALKCYQCTSHNSEPCPIEDLMECSNTQAYDRCSVEISKRPNQGVIVKRDCALAPCNLRDKEIDTIVRLRERCEMNKESFSCLYCCKEDGCNKDEAYGVFPNFISIISLTVLSLLPWFAGGRLVP